MKQLKKICAYLMVFALAFMFTAAIIPAKQVKAGSAATTVVRKILSDGSDYTVSADLTGSITNTDNDYVAAYINIDDYWPAAGGATPSAGYDAIIEYTFFVASSLDNANAGMNIACTSSATITIPVPSGYTAEGAKLETAYSGAGVSAFVPGTNSITFNVANMSTDSVTVSLKKAGATTSSDSSATATAEASDDSSATATAEASDDSSATATAETSDDSSATATAETSDDSSATATAEASAAAPATSENVQVAQNVIATAGVPDFTAGGVVGGSGVSVAGVSPITDGAALTQMTDLAARMVAMTGSQGPVTIQTAQAMDLNATGNGRVSFAVGSAFAGKVAVIGHYHDGVLYFQQRWVKADGTVDPYFSGFSPVIIMVTNQTQPLADIPTSEPGATPLSAKSSSSTAPKTGESSANTIIFIIGMVALGAAIATYRKKSY